MVELVLPKNSRIKPGKTWPKPEGSTNLREYHVYRWSPDDDKNPAIDVYVVHNIIDFTLMPIGRGPEI